MESSTNERHRHGCSREASFTLHRLLRSSSRSEVYEASLPDEDEGLVALQILPCSFENIKRTVSFITENQTSWALVEGTRNHAIDFNAWRYSLRCNLRVRRIPVIRASMDHPAERHRFHCSIVGARLPVTASVFSFSHSPSTADGLFREEFLVQLAFELLVSLRDVHRSGYVHGSLRASSILVDDESNIYVDGLLDAVPAESRSIVLRATCKARCNCSAVYTPMLAIWDLSFHQNNSRVPLPLPACSRSGNRGLLGWPNLVMAQTPMSGSSYCCCHTD